MNELTQIQRRVFEFVRDKLASGEPAPTPREIAAKFGWSSKRAAECHIEALIRKGWLTSEPGKARSLRLADAAQTVRRAVFELPVFGSIPAGFGSEREQKAEECIPVTICSSRQLRAIRAVLELDVRLLLRLHPGRRADLD